MFELRRTLVGHDKFRNSGCYPTPPYSEQRGRSPRVVAPQVHDPATTTPKTVPPVILQRVRRLTQEHEDLQNALKDDYDADKAKRLGHIEPIITLYREWDDRVQYLQSLEEILEDSDVEMRGMASKEVPIKEREIEESAMKLVAALVPKHPFAHLPCLLEIRPGPGGHEGRLFADAVFRMYREYCTRRGYRARVVKVDRSEGPSDAKSQEEPLLEAIIEVSDEGAYDHFRTETGIHRVQRVPATESKGRTHTSAVAVWVMPSFPDTGSDPDDWENPESDFYIPTADVKSEKFRSSGAGGQHVNKTESAVRLTHIPTGIVVSMQENRSQHRNREDAWRLLRSRVAQVRREEREEQAEDLRSRVLAQNKLSRGDKIRTYNYSQNRCSDHRSSVDVYNLQDVLAGGDSLDKLVKSAKDWIVERDVQALIAEEEAEAKAAKKKGK